MDSEESTHLLLSTFVILGIVFAVIAPSANIGGMGSDTGTLIGEADSLGFSEPLAAGDTFIWPRDLDSESRFALEFEGYEDGTVAIKMYGAYERMNVEADGTFETDLFDWVGILQGVVKEGSVRIKNAEKITVNDFCTDSDNGKDYNAKGKVQFDGKTWEDVCIGGELRESYCDGDIAKYEYFKCQCDQGACVVLEREILPEVRIIEPTITQKGEALRSATSPLEATVIDPEEVGVKEVRFYFVNRGRPNTLLGTDDTSPYEGTWDNSNGMPGHYSLLAEAELNDGTILSTGEHRIRLSYAPTTCTDDDGGSEPFKKGTAHYSINAMLTDKCYGDFLYEAICLQNGGAQHSYIECENGCTDGACVEIVTVPEEETEEEIEHIVNFDVLDETDLPVEITKTYVPLDETIEDPEEVIETTEIEKITEPEVVEEIIEAEETIEVLEPLPAQPTTPIEPLPPVEPSESIDILETGTVAEPMNVFAEPFEPTSVPETEPIVLAEETNEPVLEEGCNGCQEGTTCYNIGHRMDKAAVGVYCASDKKFRLQKEENNVCNDNYECKTNSCNGRCTDIEKELNKHKGIVEKLLTWFGLI